jgi:hypothetical protein
LLAAAWRLTKTVTRQRRRIACAVGSAPLLRKTVPHDALDSSPVPRTLALVAQMRADKSYTLRETQSPPPSASSGAAPRPRRPPMTFEQSSVPDGQERAANGQGSASQDPINRGRDFRWPCHHGPRARRAALVPDAREGTGPPRPWPTPGPWAGACSPPTPRRPASKSFELAPRSTRATMNSRRGGRRRCDAQGKFAEAAAAVQAGRTSSARRPFPPQRPTSCRGNACTRRQPASMRVRVDEAARREWQQAGANAAAGRSRARLRWITPSRRPSASAWTS